MCEWFQVDIFLFSAFLGVFQYFYLEKFSLRKNVKVSD